MKVLEFDHVTLNALLDGGSIQVLRDVNFGIARGETLGLVGESGAGKSMVGRIISGLLPEGFLISSGTVKFNGESLGAMSGAERRKLLGRKIAFIPQEPLTALNPVRTIGDQFDEYLAHLMIPRGERHAIALRQLSDVRLPAPGEMLLRYPHELSGGQCQRVLIAMAFSGNPSLVVADEPTTALDVVTQAQIMQLITMQQVRSGTAMLFITHDLRLAAQVCRNIGVMYAGDMVEFGPAAAVLQAPIHPYARSLLAAMPSLMGERRMLPALIEQMPGLKMFKELSGCRFASRCGVRDTTCEAGEAELIAGGDDHWARCGASCRILGAVEPGALMPAAKELMSGVDPILKFEDVRLTYHMSRGLLGMKRTSFDAVKSVSFSILPGEMIGIVGESGSGKTSIGRLIVGLERPSGGNIRVNGHDPKERSDQNAYLGRQDAQMIFQDPQSALNPRRNVLELLTQAMEGAGEDGQSNRLSRANKLAKDVRLPSDCLDRFPSQLSGGQKQRVNIGRALCVMPKLIVADEIVSGLDVSVQAHVLNLLLEMNRVHGITVVLISHDLAVVRYLCNRVFLMSRGEIVESGNTEDVFSRPQHPYTRMLMDAVPPESAGVKWPSASLATT